LSEPSSSAPQNSAAGAAQFPRKDIFFIYRKIVLFSNKLFDLKQLSAYIIALLHFI